MADEQKNGAPDAAGAEKKNKKIRFMNLSEINQAIEKTEKSQGSLNSKYSKELLKRKEVLTVKK